MILQVRNVNCYMSRLGLTSRLKTPGAGAQTDFPYKVSTSVNNFVPAGLSLTSNKSLSLTVVAQAFKAQIVANRQNKITYLGLRVSFIFRLTICTPHHYSILGGCGIQEVIEREVTNPFSRLYIEKQRKKLPI
jgi:hypothetical protein